MVKKAEKIKKRNPLVPVAGLIIGVGLAVVAAILIDPVLNLINARGALFATGSNYNLARFLVGAVLWAIMAGVAFFIASLLIGEDRKDINNIRNLPLRPRNTKKKG
jgi:hypothetical protein